MCFYTSKYTFYLQKCYVLEFDPSRYFMDKNIEHSTFDSMSKVIQKKFTKSLSNDFLSGKQIYKKYNPFIII